MGATSLKSEGAVEARMSNHQVEITVRKGFHINDKAPNKVTLLPKGGAVKASVTESRRLVFKLPKLAAKDQVKVSAYVCDDALTVCEPRDWTWDSKGQATEAGARLAEARPKTGPVRVKHGFYIDSFASAEKDCRARKQPILLLFSARWCPGCMRMEKENWDNPAMKGVLAKFAKVKLDSDRFENSLTMKKYEVAAIPTLLILNCDGEEIERFVDYQPPAPFKTALERVAVAKDLPTHAELAKRAESGDGTAAIILGKRAALTFATEEALKWYALAPAREAELEYWWVAVEDASSKAESAPSDAAKGNFIETLAKAIAKFPETPSSLDWRLRLAELQGADSKEAAKTLASLVQLCEGLIQDPARMEKFNKAEFAGDYAGIESLKVYQAKAEVLAALKKDDEAMRVWKAAVAEGGRLGIRDEPNGPFFRFLPILKQAHEKERITAFFERHLKKHPRDPELLRRYAKFLQEQGEFRRSAELALKSIAGSYDRNEVFAATVYAVSLAKSGDVAEAKRFLLKYQARKDLSASSREEIEAALAKLK